MPRELTQDDLLRSLGKAQLKLDAAEQDNLGLALENQALRQRVVELQNLVDTKQTPAGVPVGSAPRRQRRAAGRKGKQPELTVVGDEQQTETQEQ